VIGDGDGDWWLGSIMGIQMGTGMEEEEEEADAV
jgi:hypothetical protein